MYQTAYDIFLIAARTMPFQGFSILAMFLPDGSQVQAE